MLTDKLNLIRDYSITEAASVLGVSPGTLRNFEKRGDIPRARRGNGLKRVRIYSCAEIEQIGQYIRENYYPYR